jgi:hypothetical protein
MSYDSQPTWHRRRTGVRGEGKGRAGEGKRGGSLGKKHDNYHLLNQTYNVPGLVLSILPISFNKILTRHSFLTLSFR